MTPALPLLVLGLVDAAFSGFRACAGRDARIRKRRVNARAALRGLAVGAVLLAAPAVVAVVCLLTAADPRRALAELSAGGRGYLLPLALYAAVVLLSLAAYLLLPFRASTLAMVVGLGPLTLLRPLVVAAACLGAFLNGGGRSSVLIGAVAGAAVLSVGPLVHRLWYRPALAAPAATTGR
ncbi:hypothetical protein [Kitasatospora sp. NPDC004531]